MRSISSSIYSSPIWSIDPRKILLVGIMLLASAVGAHAHPHGWIDMKVQLIFNSKGEVSQMRQIWTQDEFTTAYNIEGMDNDGDGTPDADELERLGQEFLINLAAENYFLEAIQDDAIVTIVDAKSHVLQMDGAKLQWDFSLEFKQPVSLAASPFNYAFYDPSFYIEMLHIEGNKPVELVNAPKGCGWELLPPKPDADLTAYALALGQNESGGPTLGKSFAERVTISCK